MPITPSVRRTFVPLALAALLPLAARADDPAYPPPKWLGDTATLGRNVQRTMRLLATSTPEHRNTVRILFYGQSITEQGWTKLVADDLRRRFPHANLVIENRSIGGHSSQLLVKTAEADLYPFQPDLLIFHVYGAHDKYEDILRRVRERTTAEILQQNDHVTRAEAFDEETDPARLAPGKGNWDAFMNHAWLPSLARKYGTEVCDQRAVWKRYLKDHGLEPAALLRDGVHLNAHGEYLMAECVKACLRYDPTFGPAPAEAWVRTYAVGKDVAWDAGKLRLEFEGTRVVAIVRPDTSEPARVLIDGQPPSRIPGSTTFTRTSAYPGMNWPCLLRVGSRAPLLPGETWTATLRDVSDDARSFRFAVRGSITGADGEGVASAPFVSNSGRVTIDPDDWNLAYARSVRARFDPASRPPAADFQITWKARLDGADDWCGVPDPGPGIEPEVVLAQGLPAGRHVLEIVGATEGSPPLSAIRVHAPPLATATSKP